MKKALITLLYIMAAGLLAITQTLPVLADDFEDFESTLATVAREYGRVVRVGRDTRIAKDYEVKIKLLQSLAAKIQKSIQTLGLGNDFDFPVICAQMSSHYYSDLPDASSLNSNSQNDMPFFIIMVRVLSFDIKELKKLEFSSNDGGYYNPSYMERLKLMEFDRTFNFCKDYINDQKNFSNHEEYKKLYEKRIHRMKYLAAEISDKVRSDNPDFSKKYNLIKEAKIFFECYSAFSLRYNKNMSANQSGGGKYVKISPVKNNPSEEFKYSAEQIAAAINELYHSEYSTNPPEKSKADKEADIAAASSANQPESKKYAGASSGELAKKLAEAREKIYKSNNAPVGIESAVIDKYMTTLADEQINVFNEGVKKYTARGYSEDRAKSTSLLELHANLKNGQIKTSDKDAVRILSKLDENEQK